MAHSLIHYIWQYIFDIMFCQLISIQHQAVTINQKQNVLKHMLLLVYSVLFQFPEC